MKRAKRRRTRVAAIAGCPSALRRRIMSFFAGMDLVRWLIAYGPDRLQTDSWWEGLRMVYWECRGYGPLPEELRPRCEAWLSRLIISVQVPLVQDSWKERPPLEYYCSVCHRGFHGHALQFPLYAGPRGPCEGTFIRPFITCKHCHKIYVHTPTEALYEYDLRTSEVNTLPQWIIKGSPITYRAAQSFVLADRRAQLEWQKGT